MAAQPAQGLALCALAGVFFAVGPRRFGLLWEWLSSLPRRLFGRPAPPAPQGRPIQAVARDAQRLGRRFRYVVPTGVSFIRFEATRRAYDDVLAEACDMLDVPHLLSVLSPGPELDVERQRVELALDNAGLRLDDVA